MKYHRIQDLKIESKRVFLRLDLNVPLKTELDGRITVSETARIEAAIPTIEYLRSRGARCILASHLGRPKGKKDPKYSLEPVGSVLSQLLNQEVFLSDSCIGDGPRSLSQRLKQGEVLLLENLRFHPGETENSVDFAHHLAGLCDAYIDDAFGAMHRAHASTEALPQLMTQKGIGLLVEKELEFLTPLRANPKRPFALVLGGSKVSDKIGILEFFLSKADHVLIGGAMAYAFLRAQDVEIGKSLCGEDQVALASRILKSAKASGVSIFLPQDHVVASSFDAISGSVTSDSIIPQDQMGLDIGPKTLAVFEEALKGCETIFWNGPMGVFEKPAFAKGTFEMAKIIAGTNAVKLAGGGDSTAAIKASGMESKFDFISTGGGATLEYLEGKHLPGLKALEVSPNAS